MAELLVVAKAHWMDKLTPEQVDKLTLNKREQYYARSQVGDILIVKPDGHPWGTAECLPDFIVIQLPGISVGTVEHYVESFYADIPHALAMARVMQKKRRYRIPESYTLNQVALNKSVVKIPVGQITVLRNTILDKAS